LCETFQPAGDAQPRLVELTLSCRAKDGQRLAKGVSKISSKLLTPS